MVNTSRINGQYMYVLFSLREKIEVHYLTSVSNKRGVERMQILPY